VFYTDSFVTYFLSWIKILVGFYLTFSKSGNCQLKGLDFIAEVYNSAFLYIALSYQKGRIVSMHPMHPLIFEYHPGQNPPPFEQSVSLLCHVTNAV
jgi:hypothetical protein